MGLILFSPLPNNKTLPFREKATVICAVTKQYVDDEVRKLINLLARNNRLNIFGEVEILFNRFKNQFLKIKQVYVYSSVKISDKEQKEFVKVLAKYFKSDVDVVYEVDKKLIGGLKIKSNDEVIDYTLHGKLSELILNLLE